MNYKSPLKEGEEYRASSVGHLITCTMYGISDEILENTNALRDMLLDALVQDGFNIEGHMSRIFHRKTPPPGYAIIVLLTESHAAISTYPEFGSLDFDLKSCRGPRDGKRTYEALKERLKPTSVDFFEKPTYFQEGYNFLQSEEKPQTPDLISD